MSKDFNATLNLPKTDFPMRAGLPKREPDMLRHWEELDIYNETATERIVLSKETEVRYALAVCYLALIEEVEKYVRYEPDEPNYIRNTNDARKMYDMAFDIL